MIKEVPEQEFSSAVPTAGAAESPAALFQSDMNIDQIIIQGDGDGSADLNHPGQHDDGGSPQQLIHMNINENPERSGAERILDDDPRRAEGRALRLNVDSGLSQPRRAQKGGKLESGDVLTSLEDQKD